MNKAFTPIIAAFSLSVCGLNGVGGEVVASDSAKALHFKAIEQYSNYQSDPKNLDAAIQTWESAWKIRNIDIQLEYKIAWNLFTAYVVRWEITGRSSDLSAAIRNYIRAKDAQERFASDDVVIGADNKAIEVVFKKILPLAEGGNVDAAEAVGYMYYKGEGTKASPEKAFEWIEAAAKKGRVFSMSLLAKMYYSGEGVDKSEEQAVQWWKRSADKGYPAGYANLGNYYGKAKKYDEAKRWLLMAAGYEEPNAMALLGYMHWKAFGVEQSYEEAKRWLERGMTGGSIHAMRYLALMYADKKWDENSIEKARTLLQKAVEAGDCAAMYSLASMYYQGTLIPKNHEEAIKLYKMAAQQGHVISQWMYGCMLWYGRGTTKDENLAKEWMRKAANGGNKEAIKFLKSLDDWQKTQKDNEQFDARVNDLHQKALELQCRWISDPQQINRSIEYWEGALKMLKERDPGELTANETAMLYKMSYNCFNAYAVKWNNTQSQADLDASVSAYLCSLMVKDSLEQDLESLVPEDESNKRLTAMLPEIKKAAKSGHAGLMGVLGVLHMYGKAVPKSKAVAEQWLARSAKKGDPVAQYFLEQLRTGKE